MKRILTKSLLISCLLLVIVLAECGGEQPQISGGPPANTSSPPPVRSSADVVKVSATTVPVPVGGNVDATVTLSISPGFHVNANPATFSYLIPTEVTTGNVEGVSAGKPVYPSAEKKKFQFADQPLAVYEGDAQIKLPLHAATNAAKGARSLPIDVRVQACDQEKCFAPDTLHATLAVDVK